MATGTRFSSDELKQLLAECLANHEAAWRRLFSGLYGFVKHNVIRAGLRDEDVEDAVQEAFMNLIHSIKEVSGARNQLAYIGAVSRYTALGIMRERRKHADHEVVPIDPETHEPCDPGEQGTPQRPSQGERMMTEQIAKELYRILGELRPAELRIVRMRYVDDWCGDEIAYVLDKTNGSIRVTLHRIMERLRAAVSEEAAAQALEHPMLSRELAELISDWAARHAPTARVEPSLSELLEEYVADPVALTRQQRELIQRELADSSDLREHKVRLERQAPLVCDVTGHLNGVDPFAQSMPQDMMGRLIAAVRERDC